MPNSNYTIIVEIDSIDQNSVLLNDKIWITGILLKKNPLYKIKQLISTTGIHFVYEILISNM